MRYNMIDKRDRNAREELKEYTFQELKGYFKPEYDPDYSGYSDILNRWEQVRDIEDLLEYLNEEADGMDQPYSFIPVVTWGNEDVSDEEMKAINTALGEVGYNLDAESVQRWIDDDSITLNTARNGKRVVWVSGGEENEAAVYVNSLEVLSEEEIEKELC